MRNSLTMLVGLAATAAVATAAHAGDAGPLMQSAQSVGGAETVEAAQGKAHAGGCGGSSMVVVDADGDEAAQTKTKIQALIDTALRSQETAAAPQSTSVPKNGS